MKTMTITTTYRAATAFQPEIEAAVNGCVVDHATYSAIIRNYNPEHVGHVVGGCYGYTVETDTYQF